MKSLPLFALLFALCMNIAPSTSAFAMIISGGEEMNIKAKERAASPVGSAICLLEVFGKNTTLGSGVLIETDPESNTGLILTAAHFLLDRDRRYPDTIAISFANNPLIDLVRIYATEVITHPKYALNYGQDLALVRFRLPKGFSNQPMILPRGEEANNSGLLLMGGFGRFSFNEPKQEWIRTQADSVAKRIGRMEAIYQSSSQSWAKRDSIENIHSLSADSDFNKVDQVPFVFELKINPPRTDLPESFPTAGDSGGPLFVETSAKRPMVLAIFSGLIPTKGQPAVLWSSTALSPKEVEWVTSFAGGQGPKMLKLTWNFEQMLRTLESAPKRYATPPDGKTFTMDVSTSSMETATAELKRQYEEHVKATPVAQSGLKSCSACKKESASKTCGRCRDAWYCSPECQKAHWPQHRRVCKEKK